MLPILASLISPVMGLFDKVIDKTIVDKDLKIQLKNDLQSKMLDQSNTEFIAEMKAASSIILAEAQGESPAQRNWRPHLMYLIMGLLVFNGCVVPLVEAIWSIDLPTLEAWNALPDKMWDLLKIGLGGYVAGRTIEKTVKNFKGTK